jgi:hypothetical protein
MITRLIYRGNLQARLAGQRPTRQPPAGMDHIDRSGMLLYCFQVPKSPRSSRSAARACWAALAPRLRLQLDLLLSLSIQANEKVTMTGFNIPLIKTGMYESGDDFCPNRRRNVLNAFLLLLFFRWYYAIIRNVRCSTSIRQLYTRSYRNRRCNEIRPGIRRFSRT